VCVCVVIRLLWFDKAARKFGDVSKSDFHASCVLQVTHVICRPGPASKQQRHSALVLSAGTDGRLCVWNVTDVVRRFCQHRSAHSHSPQHCKSFTSLTETVSSSRVAQRSCSHNEASERLAEFHGGVNSTTSSGQSHACDTQAVFHSNGDDTGISDECKASERQAVFDAGSKVSERHGSELEPPCCVISAHQSGINALAVRLRLRLSGSLCCDLASVTGASLFV